MNGIETFAYQKMVVAGMSPEASIQALLGLEKRARGDSLLDGAIIGAVLLGLIKGGWELYKTKSWSTAIGQGLAGAAGGAFAGAGFDSMH